MTRPGRPALTSASLARSDFPRVTTLEFTKANRMALTVGRPVRIMLYSERLKSEWAVLKGWLIQNSVRRQRNQAVSH